MGVEITLLGDVTIRGPGYGPRSHAKLTSSHARLAFALLTLERESGVSREFLADALWPEGLPSSWASVLRTVVSRVRAFVTRCLTHDEELLTAGAGTYQLRIPGECKVDIETVAMQIADAQRGLTLGQHPQVQQLAQNATRMLRAPFLAERDGEWINSQREHLGELLVTGLEVLSEASSALGNYGGALTAAMEAVRKAPLRESAHRCLIAAHAMAGNRAEALCTYQRLRNTLAEELGVDPDTDTEAVYLELLGPLHPPPSSTLNSAPKPLRQAATSAPFVGRDAELTIASNAWGDALSGTAQMLLVTGEAGIGKTRFAIEFARNAAERGGRVLFGRCEPQTSVSYQPFVEMLDPVVAANAGGATRQPTNPTRSHIAELFPSLAKREDPTPSSSQTEMSNALATLIIDMTVDHPLLLVLDDAEWLDCDSAMLMRLLLRRAQDTRLLVMANARNFPNPGSLDETTEVLDRYGLLRRLRLGGLDQPSCATLVRQCLQHPHGASPSAPKIAAATAGNPRMLLEFSHDLADVESSEWRLPGSMSTSLDSFVASILGSVGPDTRDLLNAAAVAGSRFDLDVTAATAGLDKASALGALDEALTAGLVVESGSEKHGDSYQFVHELFCTALYRRLSCTKRRILHDRCADAIENLGTHLGVDGLTSLAHHRCVGANPTGDVRAVECALQVARKARASGMPSEAVQWCQRALGHVTTGDSAFEAEVLAELGIAQVQAEGHGGERALFDSALVARRCGRFDLAGRVAVDLAEIARNKRELREDVAVLVREILRHDRGSTPSEGTRLPLLIWARLVTHDSQLATQPALSTTELTTAAAVIRRELQALDGPDNLPARQALAEDLTAVGDATGDAEVQLVAHHQRAMVAAILGQTRTVKDALSTLKAVSAQRRAMVDQLLAEHDLAVRLIQGRRIEVPPTSAPNDVLVDFAQAFQTDMLVHQHVLGHWLQGSLKGAPGSPSENGQRLIEQLLPGEDVLMALARGESGRARWVVRELANNVRQLPAGDLRLHTLGVLSLAVTELNDPALAEDLCGHLAPYAELTCAAGYRSFAGTCAFHLGRLAGLCDNRAEAEHYLTIAMGQFATMGALPWIARTQLAIGTILDRRGRSSDREWVAVYREQAESVMTSIGSAADPRR